MSYVPALVPGEHLTSEAYQQSQKASSAVPDQLCRRGYRQPRGQRRLFANPGAHVPRGRSAGPFVVAVDSREKDRWKFAGRQVTIEHRALPAGDYGAIANDVIAAVVERKTLENLATSLSDGTLAFQLQRLAEVGRSAVVVEGDYSALLRTQPGRGSWLADMLGRLAVRYPEVPIGFAGSRRFAEEWAFRFFGAAIADSGESM